KAMLEQARKEGVKKVRVHTLFDGRDVGSTSGLSYIKPFEEFLAALSTDGFDYKVASGGGRQVVTMDRYNANWNIVKLGWDAHVKGIGQQFKSGTEAYVSLHEATGNLDQDLPAFVVVDEAGQPVGKIVDGDSVVNFNFRGDRAIEISLAFTEKEMPHFDRGQLPEVCYAGMMQYDGDANIPNRYLVTPPAIDRTLMEYLSTTGLTSISLSETQKYGHVTYFFNGNNSAKFNENLETWIEVPSDVIPFEQRPWMKCAEITDILVDAIEQNKAEFIVMNYPNGDMVGHTGSWAAVKISMEALDLQLGRVIKAAKKSGATLVISADHGNADDMYEHDKKGEVVVENGEPKTKTSHSLNQVPCIIFDNGSQIGFEFTPSEGLGISS
ncbi:MAG: 2,3-bisphosphoglycerate-independent phosphoglycerate mutase, partial [Lentisphaeria bacterium]